MVDAGSGTQGNFGFGVPFFGFGCSYMWRAENFSLLRLWNLQGVQRANERRGKHDVCPADPNKRELNNCTSKAAQSKGFNRLGNVEVPVPVLGNCSSGACVGRLRLGNVEELRDRLLGRIRTTRGRDNDDRWIDRLILSRDR